MKLRNKKTGEIADLEHKGLLKSDNDNHIIVYPQGALKYYTYNSLAELNEEWEDVPEEPKEYWHIAELCGGLQIKQDTDDGEDRFNKQIGNYFSTEEEAEKVVEKLKAWKRLKDKGVKFGKRQHSNYGGEMYWECPSGAGISDKQIWLDLDLLFGGEE